MILERLQGPQTQQLMAKDYGNLPLPGKRGLSIKAIVHTQANSSRPESPFPMVALDVLPVYSHIQVKDVRSTELWWTKRLSHNHVLRLSNLCGDCTT